MIRSFRHRGLKALYDGRTTRRVAPEHLEKLRDILALLDRSRKPSDMDLPGFRLHPLKGPLRGHWAVWVSGNWRVTFRVRGRRGRRPRLPGLSLKVRTQTAMAMHNPPHPGGIVRRQCLEPLGLSVTEAARGLGVTRQALSELVNEKTGISVEMAIRLAKAFGSSPEAWLGLQMAYDLWQARDRARSIEVRRFHAA
jgi:antitoxin HigA-1